MKTWTVSVFGRDVFQVRLQEDDALDYEDDEAEEDDYEEITEGMIPCECCGEMFDAEETEDPVMTRFADMTERLVWDASQSYPEPPPELFE